MAGAAAACGAEDDDLPTGDGADDAGPQRRPRDAGPFALDGSGRPDPVGREAGCNDDDGIEPSCDGVTFPTVEACARSVCDRYAGELKSRVARAAIACMASEAECATCGRRALAEACPDPSAAETCRRADEFCVDAGKPDAAGAPSDCAARIAGLRYGGRLTWLACVTSGCASEGVGSCVR
jgi:hypothetical protein